MHDFVYYPAVLCRKNREFADETFTRVQKPVRLLSAISDYYINEVKCFEKKQLPSPVNLVIEKTHFHKFHFVNISYLKAKYFLIL